MINITFNLTTKKVLIIAGAILFLFSGYQLFKSPGDNLDFIRKTLAENVCLEIVDDLPAKKDIKTLAVLQLEGDTTGFLTEQLKNEIRESGKFELMKDSFLKKIIKNIKKEKPVISLTEAVEISKELGVDGVIFGNVPKFRTDDSVSQLQMDIRMAERKSESSVFSSSYDENMDGSFYKFRLGIISKPIGIRIIYWILFAFLLPIFTIPISTRLFKLKSNTVNLIMLLSLILLDVFAAFLLTGFWVNSLWVTIFIMVAIILSLAYNYLALNYIEEKGD